MAFVLPAGDYEAALRMAGASNFMEALESGVDRQLRRRANRQQMSQSRDLYNRQKMLESANLLGEELAGAYGGAAGGGKGGGGAAGIPRMGATQAILSDAEAYQRSLDEEAAVRAQLEEALAALAVAEEPVMGFERNVFMRPEGGVYTEGDQFAFDPSRGRPAALSPAVAASPEAATQPSGAEEEHLRSVVEGIAAQLNAPKVPPLRDPWGRPKVATIGDPWSPPQVTPIGDPWSPVEAPAPVRSRRVASRPPSQQQLKARRLFDEGMRLQREGNYSQAALRFNEANAIIPHDAAAQNAALATEKARAAGATAEPVMEIDGSAIRTDEPVMEIDGSAIRTDEPVMEIDGSAIRTDEPPADLLGPLDVRPAIKGPLDVRGGAYTGSGLGPSILAQAVGQLADRGLPVTESSLQGALRQTLEATGAKGEKPLEEAVTLMAAEGKEAQEQKELAGPEVELVEEPVQIGTYTVKKGDYLHKVSSSYGVKLKALVEANRELLYPGGVARSVTSGGGKVLSGQDLIYPGEELRIPTGDGRETGGEAGPVDSREGAEKGVLAKAEGESDTLKELRAKLLKIQESRPDKPVNPFQKFGRDITFLPSLRAVAFAAGRAEQGDFSMINQMAGRVVKNYELEGLFADYRDFATGARRRADEIYMDQALEQQTKEQAQKLDAINAVQKMAYSQFKEAGYEEDDARIFSKYYADIYLIDEEQARAWGTSLNAMGKDRRTALAKKIKYGSGGGGTGGKYSTASGGVVWKHTDIKRQHDIVARLSDDIRADAQELRRLEVDTFSGKPLAGDDLAAARASDPWKRANKRLEATRKRYNRQLQIADNMEHGRGTEWRPSSEDLVPMGAESFLENNPSYIAGIVSGVGTEDQAVEAILSKGSEGGFSIDEDELRKAISSFVERAKAQLKEEAEDTPPIPTTAATASRPLAKQVPSSKRDKDRQPVLEEVTAAGDRADLIIYNANKGRPPSPDEIKEAKKDLRSAIRRLDAWEGEWRSDPQRRLHSLSYHASNILGGFEGEKPEDLRDLRYKLSVLERF